jgi:hypothetical protein
MRYQTKMIWVLCFGALFVFALSTGCKKKEKEGKTTTAEGSADEGPEGGAEEDRGRGRERRRPRGREGPGSRGEDRQGDDRRGDDQHGEEGQGERVKDDAGVWPPPGEKAPPPPGVKEAMRTMINAINAGDNATVKKLFMNRTQFLGVSDCKPKTMVDRVIGGRDNLLKQLSREKATVDFKGFTEGYLRSIKRGESAGECRAKVDVKLYQVRYNWVFNNQALREEAHFLQVGGVWFFVKL